MDFIYDPYLVLYLPLYQLDGSSFASRDAYGNPGTVAGALWRPQGRFFDAIDDVLDCGNGTSLQITEEISIDAWVNPPDNSISYPGMVTFSPDFTSWTNFIWALRLSGTTLKPTCLFVYSDGTNNGESLITSSPITAGQMSHIVVTKSVSVQEEKIYVNGIIAKTLTGQTKLCPPS